MGEGRVVLQEKDCGEYIFWARPCVSISDESVESLVETATKDNLDFLGVINGHVEVIGEVPYSVILKLDENPIYSIMVRNVCAGIYKKDFLCRYNIAVRENQDTIFPDLDVLWRTFIYAERALFVDSSVCEEVSSDTVFINDTAAAFDVNRRYDYIRNLLMENWDRWLVWRPYFCLQRYRCYFEILHWMKDDVAWEFAERMVVDMHRSRELDEMDDGMFTAEERTALHIVDLDPGFLKRYFLGSVMHTNMINNTRNELLRETNRLRENIRNLENELSSERARGDELEAKLENQRLDYENRLEQQMQKYETSTTFRVGKVVMFMPISLKKLVKKALGRTP